MAIDEKSESFLAYSIIKLKMKKAILLFFTALSAVMTAFAQDVILAKDGKALFDVFISENASEKTKENAGKFVEYLYKITGASFKVSTGNSDRGIIVGTVEDFPFPSYSKKLDAKDPFRRDEYIIKSHKNGLHIIGSTEFGVQNGIWDFLYRIGYRQFFPTSTWEIIPEIKVLKVDLDIYSRPSFFGRRIGKGHGFWSQNRTTWNDWIVQKKRNRNERISTTTTVSSTSSISSFQY
ncbi:MAG: hypothetical protein NC830_06245 [Candidatus Omnitrophica bacterium]|nr:hypothetical protein [Candidatus Omnitrophota bacterium]